MHLRPAFNFALGITQFRFFTFLQRKVTAFIDTICLLPIFKYLIRTFAEDSLAVVKPSMVVMGRDGRPVHRFEIISRFGKNIQKRNHDR